MSWKKIKISEIGEVVTGKTPPTKDTDNYGGIIPFITPSDMNGDRKIFSTERYISERGKATVKNCVLPPKTICVSCIGSDMGKVVITTEESITNQQINSIKCYDGYDYNFIYYLLLTQNKKIKSLGKNATAVPILNKSKFSDLEVIVPDYSIQKKISNILKTYDDLIENNKKQIKLLEEAAQRLYKEWFVDLRFPGHEEVAIVDGVPEGWKESTLREVALLKAGGDRPKIFSKKRNTECNIPVYSNGTEKEGLYGYTNVPEIQDDCVTISARGSVGYICLRRTAFVPIVRLISAIPKNIDVIYLYLYLQNFKFDGNGAAQQQITVPMIKDKSVLLPTKEILDDFAKMVHPMQDAIENCKVQIERLIEARDLLLPKLISGEIEV